MSGGKKMKAQKVEDNQLQVLVDVLESSKTEPIDQCVAKVTAKMHENHQFAFTIAAWCDSAEMTALVDGSLIEKLNRVLKETAEASAKGKGKKGKNSLGLTPKMKGLWKALKNMKYTPDGELFCLTILKHLLPDLYADKSNYSNNEHWVTPPLP
jgi:hypothetical protein